MYKTYVIEGKPIIDYFYSLESLKVNASNQFEGGKEEFQFFKLKNCSATGDKST